MMPASGLDTEAKRSLTEWIYRKNERNFAELSEKTCICQKFVVLLHSQKFKQQEGGIYASNYDSTI